MKFKDINLMPEVESQLLNKMIKKYSRTGIQNIVFAFAKNMDDAIFSVKLPLMLTTKQAYDELQLSAYYGRKCALVGNAAQAVIYFNTNDLFRTLSNGKFKPPFNKKIPKIYLEFKGMSIREIIKLAGEKYPIDDNKWWVEMVDKSEETQKRIVQYGRERLNDFTKASFDIESARLKVNAMSLTSIWTAFEVLSSELWNHAVKIVSPDIRPKSFTNPKKISQAYYKLFNNKKYVTLIDTKEVNYLVQLRHIITHNAGNIDDNFNARTGSNIPIGTLMLITTKYVIDQINLILKLGERFIAQTLRDINKLSK